ncbi:MAG: hypothetical protein ACTHNO_12380 [Ralstonia sp.]|uniref:ATPase n=1 Tax=Ralstonia chuxiongensis TaxID=2957504 RepID=A0AA42BIF3_9RALS|nr:hypothetical protein [Ralstonia chuxiongensis]MCP1170792.1 hypothetical protein [Ralstonia chuxiongensis]
MAFGNASVLPTPEKQAPSAEDESLAPVRGTAKTNPRRKSEVDVHYEPEPLLIFRPETGEFICIPAHEVTAFENDANLWDMLVDTLHKANAKVDDLAEELHQLQIKALRSPAEQQKLEKALDDAYKEAKAAHEKLHGALTPLGKMDSGHMSIVEIIPIYNSAGGPVRSFRKYTARYVRSDRIKSKWDRYIPAGWEKRKGTAAEKDSAHKAFASRAFFSKQNDQLQFNKDELKKGAGTLSTKFKGDLLKIETHSVQGALTAWADGWNKKLTYDRAARNPDAKWSRNIDLTAQAQLMRYFAGVGLSTEWDPLKGNCALKASGRAEFAVAEAKAAGTFYFPDRVGWVWRLTDNPKDKSTAIRFAAELAVSAMAGASIVGEVGIAVDWKDEKRKELGLYGAAVSGAGNRQRELRINQKPVDPSAKAELEVFAGAKAEIKLWGGVQWLNPEQLGLGYQEFAKVGETVTGMLGAGAGCLFELSYAAGKFRFRMMASVCLGVGAKGALELEVDVGQIVQFWKWLAYQLYHADYKQLKFIAKEAFEYIVKLQVMIIEGTIEKMEQAVGWAEDEITAKYEEIIARLDQEERRVQLMNRIIANPHGFLRYTTPEAKGVMLYQMTRHDWKVDGLDGRNHGGRYYGRRKDAVKKILREAQTRRDFDNVVQHMSADGSRCDATLTAKNRAQLRDFLNTSLVGSSGDGQEIDTFYDNLQASLKAEPTRGYAMCENTSPTYLAQRDYGIDHSMLADIGSMAMPPTTYA